MGLKVLFLSNAPLFHHDRLRFKLNVHHERNLQKAWHFFSIVNVVIQMSLIKRLDKGLCRVCNWCDIEMES